MTRYASEAACDTFADLEARAMGYGYLVAVWPHREPHRHPVEIDHTAATLNIFEPHPATDEGDQAVLGLMSNAVAAIEVRDSDQ